MDYADMPGPEEYPDDHVDEGEEPRPPWLDSSGESSEISDVDSERSDMLHVIIHTQTLHYTVRQEHGEDTCSGSSPA